MQELQEHLTRLNDLRGDGFWLIDEGRVNIEDFIGAMHYPNRIVRVMGSTDGAVKYINHNGVEVGCVAGWLSEDV